MIKYVAALLWLLLTSATAAERSEAVIVLKDNVSVDRVELRLSDIADVQTLDIELRSRLANLHVGSAPAIGMRRTIRRDDVLRLLTAMDDRPLYVGQGAARTIIQRNSNFYSAEKLAEAARDFVKQQLAAQHPMLTRVDVSVDKLADIRVPAGEIVLRPRSIRGNRLARRISVWVDVVLHGKLYRSVPVWLSVQAYAPVLVAQRGMGARELLLAADVAVEERDVAGIGGMALMHQQDIAGQRTRTSLARGTILRASDVEINPSVLKDQEVEVRVTTGTVRITTRAIAQEEGHFGSIIRVRNPSSALVYRARVVGDRAVAAIDGGV